MRNALFKHTTMIFYKIKSLTKRFCHKNVRLLFFFKAPVTDAIRRF